MTDSNKANEDMLNALHHMVAIKLAQMLKEAEGEPDMMLRVLREARGFLKDNEVSADIATNPNVRQLESNIKVAELPFSVEDSEEE